MWKGCSQVVVEIRLIGRRMFLIIVILESRVPNYVISQIVRDSCCLVRRRYISLHAVILTKLDHLFAMLFIIVPSQKLHTRI